MAERLDRAPMIDALRRSRARDRRTSHSAGGTWLARGAMIAALLVSLGALDWNRDTVFIDVELEHFELRATADGITTPVYRVATGTPAHPTPTGRFDLRHWIGNPGYTPGPAARANGAVATRPSRSGPLGYAKIPFFRSFQVHGGAHRYALGAPVTLGCVQLTDDAMRRLEAWLAARGALEAGIETPHGEVRHLFRRPPTLVIR